MENWRYPLSDLVLGQEEEDAVLRVIRSRWLSMGPETSAFENEFCQAITSDGVSPRVLATSNCTSALHMALLALRVGPGDEVIVPALSFVATSNSILYTGATPVFADISSLDHPLISSDEVERLITERTKAIIVMHYAGYPCEMARISKIARERGIFIIEDAAHAAGSILDGRACGTWGDIGCFSLFGNKNLPAGEGGIFVTQDISIYNKAKMLRSHGMTSLSWDRNRGHAVSYDVLELGYNFRMPELSAAVAREQLKRLAIGNQKRDLIFQRYLKAFEGPMSRFPEIIIPFCKATDPGSRHLFPVLLPRSVDRAGLMDYLKNRGIQSSIHYHPIYKYSYYQGNPRYRSLKLPKTEEYSERVVTLPFHPRLEESDVEAIVSEFMKALG